MTEVVSELARALRDALRGDRTDPSAATSVSGSQADYDAFLSVAMKVAATEIVLMRADPQLALHNLQIGIGNVLAEHPRLATLPETDVEQLASSVRIALAVIFAATQVAPAMGGAGLAQRLARATALRALLLKTADALALAGLVPKAEVDTIRKGRGRLDAARDLVALAALFSKHGAALRGKHAVTAAQRTEAAGLGTELLTILKPGRAKRTRAKPAVGTDERDRLWTLLVKRHDQLWRAGAYLFGRELVDAKVPSLQASRGGRRKKVAAPTPGAPLPIGV